MKKPFNAAILIVPACCCALPGCVNSSKSPDPIAVVVPAPTHPHLILTADRSSVRHGQSVHLTATLVNPTKHRIVLPTTSLGDNNDLSIEHRLHVDWKADDRRSASSGFSVVNINICPPSIDYLEPGTSRSYPLLWKFEERGRGVVTLTYSFVYSESFPPVTITLATY